MAIRKMNGVEAADAKLLLNKMNSTAAKVRLGNLIGNQRGSVRGLYDFSVNGGAVGAISLLDEDGQVIKLPNKAIVTNVLIDIITAVVSTGNNGTMALGLNTTTDLLAAVDGDTLSGVAAGIPVGTAATAVKLTAERTLTLTIGTNAFTAGKFAVHVDFLQSV
jgi:hypothetical protein